MRVALLTGGTAAQNLQFDPVHKERSFDNFADPEVENNRSGLVRWNKMEVVERKDLRPGWPGRRIADGGHECSFVCELRPAPQP